MDFLGSEQHVQRERDKARLLRKSRWWQNLRGRAVCYYCQKALSKDAVTMDHIVPVAQGGFSTPGNVVPACKACNTRKRDRSAVEMVLEQASSGNVSV